MKLAPVAAAFAVATALPSLAVADIYRDGPVLDYVEAFANATPEARKALDKIAYYLFPGNQGCNAGGPAPGGHTQMSISPDGKLLLAITTVRPEKKVRKALRITNADEDTTKEIDTTLLVGVTSTGSVWSILESSDGACDRDTSQFAWSTNGKRALVLMPQPGYEAGVYHLAVLDPKRREVLHTPRFTLTGDLEQLTYVNDKRFTVCAEGVKWQLDYDDTAFEVKLKKLGACPPVTAAPPVAAPVTTPPAHGKK